ncbi:efflux RND transporter periplasmic adaptor subunit [Curvibacter sp. APW13]|uniref:efflux RND transporter periplasmic adaptor subunit n=1 Tax=Curvibacter sp. APW13 TaxID=3077236 RepID=UPI0028DF9F10|nr:efflux RND transporter periplasmic adaptor subunit [Curvibacter sp. APW13]MDT8991839.1 efflux RND transporter periplasmic adaptor subunit [Curvibacter sp. APW13]
MKPWMKWAAATATVVLLGAVTVRLLSARNAKEEALQAQQALLKTAVVLQVNAADVTPVQQLELPVSIAITGSLKAVDSAVVKARIAGELRDLVVREGDTVKAGQVLARIEPTEYQARLKQAQEQAESAKGQLDIAKRNFENNRSLVDQGFISKTALDTSAASLASAQATYQAAQAGADVARKTLDDAVLRAPISGQVSQRLAQPGERVGVDARIIEIVNGSRLELETALSPAESLLVRPGQVARLRLEGSNQDIRARVVRINPSANTSTRTVTAYLSIDSTGNLRQGLFAQGQLATGATTKALAVPLASVRTDKPQPYVQVLQDGKVQHVPVTVTLRSEWQGQPYAAVEGVAQDTPVLAGTLGAVRAGTAATVAKAGN